MKCICGIYLAMLTVLVLMACNAEKEHFGFEKVREIPLRLGEGNLICQIFDLVLDDDGRFYLADKDCHKIWVVDENGRMVTDIGGAGKRGPGELGGPISLAISGDTLAVLESDNFRISFFRLDGEFLFSMPLEGGGHPSGIEFGRNDTLIVSDALGVRFYDFYTISGGLLPNDVNGPKTSILQPVMLVGGHMSLANDGNVLYSYIREYTVEKINWRGEKLSFFSAKPSDYRSPDLSSRENYVKQYDWSILRLPLQIDDIVLVQWWRRRVDSENPNKITTNHYIDLFTEQGESIQLAIPAPCTFIFSKNRQLYGIEQAPSESEAANPSIIVYRLVKGLIEP